MPTGPRNPHRAGTIGDGRNSGEDRVSDISGSIMIAAYTFCAKTLFGSSFRPAFNEKGDMTRYFAGRDFSRRRLFTDLEFVF